MQLCEHYNVMTSSNSGGARPFLAEGSQLKFAWAHIVALSVCKLFEGHAWAEVISVRARDHPCPCVVSLLRSKTRDIYNETSIPQDGHRYVYRILKNAESTAQFLRTRFSPTPVVGIICGSGLGGLADQVENQTVIDFKDIPGFPVSTGGITVLQYTLSHIRVDVSAGYWRLFMYL